MTSVARVISLLLVALTCCAAGAQQVVNSWDAGLESWRFDYGASGATIVHDPSVDANGNPASGSLKLTMPFDVGANGNNNRFAFTGDVFPTATNLSSFTSLEFSILVAPGSALDAFGNHGYVDFASRETDGYNWNGLAGFNLAPATGWTTITAPASSLAATRAFTFQLWGGPQQNITGPVTVWLDNVRLIPEPAAASLLLGLAAFFLSHLRRR